jgi:hypothetical protein
MSKILAMTNKLLLRLHIKVKYVNSFHLRSIALLVCK